MYKPEVLILHHEFEQGERKMGFLKQWWLMLLFTIVMASVSICNAQGTSQPSESEQYLQGHNRARAEVGVAALRWSAALEAEASRIARYQRNNKGCNFADGKLARNHGMNQHWQSGTVPSPLDAVNSWVETKKYYNYANNSCVQNESCGTYTQVVWRKSSELGCSRVTCAGQVPASLTICMYNPPGNVVGEKPY